MERDFWYRHTTWTPEDEAEFRAGLKRTRGRYHKATYFRIQAYHLQEAGGWERLNAALALLDELLSQQPDEFNVLAAFTQKAECLEQLGRIEEASASFRECFATQRANPGVHCSAHLSFGSLVVVRLGRVELYNEVLDLLVEFAKNEILPVQYYERNIILAYILSGTGLHSGARDAARRALSASAITDSGMRYHRRVGLVTDPDPAILRRLRKIASGGVLHRILSYIH